MKKTRIVPLVSFALACQLFAQGAPTQVLEPRIAPDALSSKALGDLPGTNRLTLAISLPWRNGEKLGLLLQQISDPASPNFRHYLTPAEFAEQYGPSETDYRTVAAFAKAHGLTVSGTHPNRMLLDVSGSVADIEKAFHVKMKVYQHPTEARTFYAADGALSLDLSTTILDVNGLDNYSRPVPRFVQVPQNKAQSAAPNSGSGSGGTYLGKDFRAAYVPNTTLTGAGQNVGLLEFDGYTASDIAEYENLAGLSSVTLSNVLLDGFGGQPTGDGGEIEVSLDIEMAISMAPGLSAVVVYEAGPEGNWHDILNRMADDNLAKQMSCSWYIPDGGPDPVAEQIFQQMAAQGQTFFAASGDSDAYTGLIPFPGDSTNITEVGGTTLTTSGPGGAWVSETVWNWGDGQGSGGGISTSYPIPTWQTNINMTANQGSTTKRNTPDVALTANNAFVFADGEGLTGYGGTSFAAPLWAGFTALANQQAVMSGRPTVGFINPALDAIGSGVNYTNCFHDITTGNNTSPSSPQKFIAVAGYDLCTGWGVPAGQSLINALATPDPLGILPASGFTAIGGSGGPFTVNAENFVLTNAGTNALSWSMINTTLWLTVSPPSGTLAAGAFDPTPLVSLSAAAYSLPIGTNTGIVTFSNLTTGTAQSRQFTLEIVPSVPPTILSAPSNQLAAVGSSATFTVMTGGTPPQSFQWQVNTTNINEATNASLTLSNLSIGDSGTYSVTVTNTFGSTNAAATLTVGYPPSITDQPQAVQTVQNSNATFSVTAAGTGSLSYQWYFYSTALAQATNSSLTLTDIQSTNSGLYSVTISNAFGSLASSNASLTIELFPIIVNQPQSQGADVGSNLTLSVTATGTSAVLPIVSSGTLQLWLRADEGVVTNSSGLVSEWEDQSDNTNHAFQSNTNLQPELVAAAGLGGRAAVRFNGIQNNVNGSYMAGTESVGVPNAMTAFTVYNAFSTTNNENLLWDIGVPGYAGGSRGDMTGGGDMDFICWSDDHIVPFLIPTNTYRIWTDRLDTNLDTLNMFDATANTSTNFTVSVTGTTTPGAGYYIGGLNSSLPYVGSSRNFNGDIAEFLCYSGYLSEADRLAVTGYLEEKYFQVGPAASLSYQWQFNGMNIANATNATLTLTNVQFSSAGSYTVIVSNLVGTTISSNALVAVGYAPAITNQPQSQQVVQNTNVAFTVGVSGTGPVSYQWYFDGLVLPQATNTTLTLTNVQGINSGSYSVVASSPFGSVSSSNAILAVELMPVIVTQPQSQTVAVGSNVAFSVTVANNNGAPQLPAVSSGTLQLWLRADAGVVTNSAGLVSQWQDQSPNSNNAAQATASLQPMLVSAAGLSGKAAVRFNGIQNNVSGSYMSGSGSVGVPNAMTAFTVYNAFSTTNAQDVLWDIGVPGNAGASRGDMVGNEDMDFICWSDDHVIPFLIPTNTYRIWTDRLDTNLDTLNMFDATATTSTNFTVSVTGTVTPGAGYYLGGLNSSLPYVGSSRNFDGDIAEFICYSGYLSETDRLAVANYLENKYFQPEGSGPVSYQWQFNGANIANATNATLTVPDVQLTNAGIYTVTVSNLLGVTISSNALLAVGYAPTITNQPQSQEAVQGNNVSFTVGFSGTGPASYQWYFDGAALAQDTNSALTLTDVQATNSGTYTVLVSSPYGSVSSSNATLAVELLPIILNQPQSQTVVAGANVTLSVTVANTNSSPTLPTVSSGTLQLWLRADAGVITNAAGLVSQWQDQSSNTNHAFQANTSSQPLLVSAAGLSGKAAVRFNGIQDNINGSYMVGTGSVGVPNAMTAFTVYNAFSTTNAQDVLWDIGVPGNAGASRGDMVGNGEMDFICWSDPYLVPFVIPTNTYRIWTDRLDTNRDTLNMFDATATTSTNFTMTVTGTVTPAAGYYLGGLNPSLPTVVSGRNFDGDIVEFVCYSGYLSETDRLAVANYLEQKYFQAAGNSPVTYQWQLDGANIANATNATLTLPDVQPTNDGLYTVIVSNVVGVTVSSNALLAVGYAPAITNQPQSQEVLQGANVAFSVGVSGTGPVSYQWYFNGTTVAQGTNSSLELSDVQAVTGGSYSVIATTPFGSIPSSNAVLKVDLYPIIVTQPQSQTINMRSNVTFSVATTTSLPALPVIGSGTVQLWLRADAGVITNAAGLVSQWQDQSANTNHAFQANTNLQPLLVSAAGLGGKAAVRFNGIQNNINGSYLEGTGSVGVPNAMTAFTVYNAFSTTNNENLLWDIGVPGYTGGSRGDMTSGGDMTFICWSDDHIFPFLIPTNTYRIWTDRLDTNLDTLDIFDTTASSSTNSSFSVANTITPGAGYYIGGLNSSLPYVGSSRNFNGDIVEFICYSGYLTETDRLAVTTYLEQKYFQSVSSENITYQWQFDGTNIASATNSSLTLTNVQATNDGDYSVIVSNGLASTVSSNAVLVVDTPPVIRSQPGRLTVTMPGSATFTVFAKATPAPTYQWTVNGIAVAGATGATLFIPNVVPSDGGNYSVTVSNSLGVAVSSNALLVANYVLGTAEGQAVQIATANLTLPSTVQPGKTFTVSSVDGTSQQGATLQLGNGTITYTPPGAFTGMDLFNYVLTPSSGPAITGSVTVFINSSFILGATVNGGQATIQFAGLPETTYTIEASTNLVTWTAIGSVTSGPNGLFEFVDANAGLYKQRYYRTVAP